MSDATQSIDVHLDLTITTLTPLCVGASGSSGGLADKALQRDGWNRPIIPGSQVKGRVRHACERIAAGMGIPICAAPDGRTMCPNGPQTIFRTSRERLDRLRGGQSLRQCVICAIFGSPIYPSPLRFSDLAATPPAAVFPPPQPYETSERLRPGVGIDRRRRTALEQVFYLTETTDHDIVFSGVIQGCWHDTPRAAIEPLIGLLIAGFALTTRWGGGSSRGLGWGCVEITRVEVGDSCEQSVLIGKVSELCRTES